MGVQYKQGNITSDDADILVCTVNCVGVMGKGIALAFKEKWPSIVPVYRAACQRGKLLPGGCLLFPLPVGIDGRRRYWAALATKDHWKNDSRYEWIESGLAELARVARISGASSIAIPPPGCGNGNLDWEKVHPMVVSILSGFNLRIYGWKKIY